jgi:Zn-dependent protease with chaperone function
VSVKRSFWVLVAIASTVEGIAILLLWRAAAAQLPCHFSFLPMNVAAMPACVQAVPFVGRRAWLPALLLGGIVLATLVLASWELVRQLLRVSRLNHSLNALGESKGTDPRPFASSGVTRSQVVRTDALLCFCVGLLRPRVVVSTALIDALSPAELQAALAHEASHQRRHDPLRLLVGRVATRGLFFIPSLRELQWSSRVATEIAADTAAARSGGTGPLLGALRELLRPDAPRSPVAVSAMAPSDLLPERVAALTGNRPPVAIRPARLAASAVALALVILLALAVPSGVPLTRLLPVHPMPVHTAPVHPVHGSSKS